MRRILLVVISILTLTSTMALADQASHKRTVLELLEITNARNMIEQVMGSLEAMMKQQFEEAASQLPPEGREAADAAQKEMMRWLSDLLSWEQMRDMSVNLYTQVFTEDEIKELIQFYKSPIGQKMIKRMPELIQASMQQTQILIQKKMPELQERLKKTLSDLEAKYKK